MKKTLQNGLWAWGIILAVLVIDQWLKIYVKLHFVLRESVEVTSWFYLSFIENNGMAYGMELGNKLFLTVFRILAVAVFSYVLWRGIRRGISRGLVVCFSLAIAGALGNIIDCVCYGRLFTDSYGHVAGWAGPLGVEGYAPWFQGRVVDMLYFPLVEFNWPEWVPAAGQWVNLGVTEVRWPSWLPCSDEAFRFFEPVFNFADSAISVGFACLLLFYRSELSQLMDTLGRKKH